VYIVFHIYGGTQLTTFTQTTPTPHLFSKSVVWVWFGWRLSVVCHRTYLLFHCILFSLHSINLSGYWAASVKIKPVILVSTPNFTWLQSSCHSLMFHHYYTVSRKKGAFLFLIFVFLIDEWAQLDQSIVDAAIGQWRRRLHACVRAREAHFEHKFWHCWPNMLLN